MLPPHPSLVRSALTAAPRYALLQQRGRRPAPTRPARRSPAPSYARLSWPRRPELCVAAAWRSAPSYAWPLPSVPPQDMREVAAASAPTYASVIGAPFPIRRGAVTGPSQSSRPASLEVWQCPAIPSSVPSQLWRHRRPAFPAVPPGSVRLGRLDSGQPGSFRRPIPLSCQSTCRQGGCT